MSEDDFSIVDYIAEYDKQNPIDYDAIAKGMIERADRQYRTTRENYRYEIQMQDISHNDIRDYVAKKLEKLLGLSLVEKESKLVNGIIDILAMDKHGNYVGIEIKKKANKKEYEQFVRYSNELREKYGTNSRLIVLAHRYISSLLDLDLNYVELRRYEIWWKHGQTKKNNKNYSIDDLRTTVLEEDGGVNQRLFEDRIAAKKVDLKKKTYKRN